MLFRDREPFDPRVAGKVVMESLRGISTRVVSLPSDRRIGFEQVIQQARAAMADHHLEFAEALASVLEVAVSEAEDDQRRSEPSQRS
ncbi:MAG TPA: hypothetical protein VNJ51_01330 [Candidatus Dormibacteraeota bacterium]|nr:hypothetical protein [Candidatus Dormibacteraeota bacterium]